MKLKQKSTRDLSKALKDNSLSRAEYIRVQAVYLKKQGYPLKEIERISGKSFRAVQTWITAYNQDGTAGLKTQERQCPTNFVLAKEQKDKIKQLVTDNKPRDLKLSGDFWSVPTIRQLVKNKYKVEYQTERSYQNLLRYCGFSYQKAEYIDKRKDDKSGGHFKERFKKRLKGGVITMSW